jgi:hypothetical protein
MTMGWGASGARPGHTPADGSVMSRSPRLAVAFVLALILKEIPLHTRARQDAAQADPTSRHARGRRSHHARPVPIPSRPRPGEYTRALSAGGVPAGCLRRRRDKPAAG